MSGEYDGIGQAELDGLERAQDVYVYIAGPYTAPDPIVNTRNAILAADEIRSEHVHPFVPHLNVLWHFLSPAEYKVWLRFDFVWLIRCNALIRLPGHSPGADDEVAEAKRLGIPVYYSVEDFLQSVA